MRHYFRFGLLSLFVVSAIIAIGMKLWLMPYVVEMPLSELGNYFPEVNISGITGHGTLVEDDAVRVTVQRRPFEGDEVSRLVVCRNPQFRKICPMPGWKANYRFFKLTERNHVEVADGPTAIDIVSFVFYVSKDGALRGPCFLISDKQQVYYSEGIDRQCTWIYDLTPERRDLNGNQLVSNKYVMKTIENEIQWIKSGRIREDSRNFSHKIRAID